MALHLTRVAFGATSLADLVSRIESNRTGNTIRLTTRFLPKRHAEVVDGGSLYWIIKHQLVGRARVLAFEDRPDGRIDMVLEAKVTPVNPVPRRAHQGWRYLNATDAPTYLGHVNEGEDVSDLPPTLLTELAELSLI
ncbi:DUF1489 family protein [Chakrabartia godavariana]|nr:DUF1489 family protein [Chakrabartia godavariana]